jgi:uncharacterized protein (TIGR02246 family)
MTANASVESFFGEVASVWKTNDGAAFAELFSDDGSLINPFGERADGRSAIAAMYSQYFAGMLSGTTTVVTLGPVRHVGADHAFVDVDQTIAGPDGSVVLVVHLAALLRKDGDSWRIVDGRPYSFAEIPG